MWNKSNMTFFRFYENFLELFKSRLLFHDLRITRKACSRRSWKNYKYVYVIYQVASHFLFLVTVKGIRFATGFHENWNLELCNLNYQSGYLQIFLSSKVRVMYIVFFEALNINTPWWHWIVVIAHVVFSAKSRLQCSWKSHSSSSFKQQQRHFFHEMCYVQNGPRELRSRSRFMDFGGMGARENFSSFYKMACKSLFLLQIKYIEKFKLLLQLQIVGGGEVKLCYYAMKGSIAGGGGGGGPHKKIFKKI